MPDKVKFYKKDNFNLRRDRFVCAEIDLYL